MPSTRTHVSIKTAKLQESIEFYSKLFDAEPVKSYADYAKFDLPEPGLNLTLNQVSEAPTEQSIDHLGLEFATRDEIAKLRSSLESRGIAIAMNEGETACCYGTQDKFWVEDPNGINWELYSIIEADTGVASCSTLKPEPVALAAAGFAPAGGC